MVMTTKQMCWVLMLTVFMVCAGASFAAEQDTAVSFALKSPIVAPGLMGAVPEPQTATDSSTPSHHEMSADEIAKNLANPNSDLAQLKFQNQYYWYKGDLPHADHQSNYLLLFQPIFPYSLGPNANGDQQTFYFRPAFPILVDQPASFNAGKGDFDKVTALGDIQFDAAYGVTRKDGLLWAVGMLGTLPTGTDEDVTGGQLRLGPEFLISKKTDFGFIGLFPSHQWDVTGWRDGYYSTTKIEPFITWLPGGGWAIRSDPKMYYDWHENQWTIPLNLIVGKTVKMGKTPVRLELELNYYVEQSDEFGPDWMIGFNFTPVVENIFSKWLKGE